jgi:hypothetical protein
LDYLLQKPLPFLSKSWWQHGIDLKDDIFKEIVA